MTKLEKIKEAYGSRYQELSRSIRESDGSVLSFRHLMSSDFYWELFGYKESDIDCFYPDCEPSRWRPKSLKGIEHNNGWQKIESEDDLPEECDVYKVIQKGGANSQYYFNGHSIGRDYWLRNFSHWKPIIKDLPPIY